MAHKVIILARSLLFKNTTYHIREGFQKKLDVLHIKVSPKGRVKKKIGCFTYQSVPYQRVPQELQSVPQLILDMTNRTFRGGHFDRGRFERGQFERGQFEWKPNKLP